MQTLADKLRILLDAEENKTHVDVLQKNDATWLQVEPKLFSC